MLRHRGLCGGLDLVRVPTRGFPSSSLISAAYLRIPLLLSRAFGEKARLKQAARTRRRYQLSLRPQPPPPLPPQPSVVIQHSSLPRTPLSYDVFKHLAASASDEKRDDSAAQSLPPPSPTLGEQPAALPAPYPALMSTEEVMFAVVDVNAQQHKVVKNALVMCDKLVGTQVGQQLVFDKVLLVGTQQFTAIGRPYLEQARVTATVEEQTHTAKVLCFKKRRRTSSSKRLKGHRAQVTLLRIDNVEYTDRETGQRYTQEHLELPMMDLNAFGDPVYVTPATAVAEPDWEAPAAAPTGETVAVPQAAVNQQ
jgi:ribosomal protein L21